MHELSLAYGLVEQIQQVAEREHASRVVSVAVVIGLYSGVEAQAFEFAFPFAAEDTIAAGADLLIEKRPVTVLCRLCEAETHPEPTRLICQKCGSNNIELKGGREFLIRTIELDVP